jgi:HAD superfamily hydrolase (TIGR01509 family)
MLQPLKALLFDLDGTLVHTDPLHFAAWRRALEPHGIPLDEATYERRIWGRHNPDIVRDLLPQLDATDGAAFADAKEAAFREAAAGLQPLPGAAALMEDARAAGVAVAVVTNAPRLNAEFMLHATGLAAPVDLLTIGEECAAPKPDPAPYRETLERLNVTASEALAFEDSPSGLRSAAAAGLTVVGMTTTQPADDLLAAGAKVAWASFADVGLQDVANVLG